MSDFSSIIENSNFAGIIIVLDRNFNIERANDNFLNLLDYKEIDIFSIIKLLNLKDYPKFPFDLTYWGRNENYVARITRNRILILGKKELSDDTKNHLKRIIK